MQAYKCYIIRLENNKHSCNVAQDCYEQAVKHGLQPVFFSAIDGNDADYHYETTGIKKAKKFKKNRPGVMGCFFSHYYIWKECVESNTPIIVLEHDGYVIKDISTAILDSFTEVLKLDNQDPFSKTYDTDIYNADSNVVDVIKYYNPNAKNTSTKEFNGTGNYMRGAYSYIVKPHGAKKLIEFIDENGHLPADQQIGDLVVDIKVTSATVARLHPLYTGDNIRELSLTRN